MVILTTLLFILVISTFLLFGYTVDRATRVRPLSVRQTFACFLCVMVCTSLDLYLCKELRSLEYREKVSQQTYLDTEVTF